MPRPLRTAVGGIVYHALNRANSGLVLFEHDGDYAAFEEVVFQALDRTPIRILSYSWMPTHWHFVLWPLQDGDLSDFLGWMTQTHVTRRHAFRQCVGVGHLYQGRFKALPVQEDEHFLTVCRYVERNPLRAGLVARAEDWRWSSLWRRRNAAESVPIADWPVPRPAEWVSWVNAPQTDRELEAIRDCVRRSRPYGSESWLRATGPSLGWQPNARPRGRPRKSP